MQSRIKIHGVTTGCRLAFVALMLTSVCITAARADAPAAPTLKLTWPNFDPPYSPGTFMQYELDVSMFCIVQEIVWNATGIISASQNGGTSFTVDTTGCPEGYGYVSVTGKGKRSCAGGGEGPDEWETFDLSASYYITAPCTEDP